MYWAESRFSGFLSGLYKLLTLGRNKGKYRGHIQGDDHFWGDACKERITYYRNFVFQDINTLKACPFMPYHDTDRPLVNYWFASSNGRDIETFNRCLAEENQDRLGGGGRRLHHVHPLRLRLQRRRPGQSALSKRSMRRLARRNGWFVPVHVVLDHLREAGGGHEITDAERGRLERKWVFEKIRIGTI